MKVDFLLTLIMVITFDVISGFSLRASERCDTIANVNDSVSKPTSGELPRILTPYHWNVIKFNPTPMLIFSETRNITFSYERLIRKNQSMSLQLGYLIIPVYFNDTIANLITLHDQARTGINIGLDYRFYPSLRNRRPAPDGMYLGTYLSYYGFNHSNKFNTIKQPSNPDGSIKGSLSMINLGFELGYQFLFGKRFSIDLLMFGPSLTYYSTKSEIIGSLDESEIDEIDGEIADKLIERFPALGYLFDGETNELTNSNFKLTASFRYSIQFGFHF